MLPRGRLLQCHDIWPPAKKGPAKNYRYRSKDFNFEDHGHGHILGHGHGSGTPCHFLQCTPQYRCWSKFGESGSLLYCPLLEASALDGQPRSSEPLGNQFDYSKGLSQTFHVLGRCGFHVSFVQFSGCTLGALKTTGWYIVSCYLLHLRIDNIGSHLSSCQKPTHVANLKRDVVLVSEHKIGLSMSHEVVQHTGEGAKGVIFNQVLFTSQNLTG